MKVRTARRLFLIPPSLAGEGCREHLRAAGGGFHDYPTRLALLATLPFQGRDKKDYSAGFAAAASAAALAASSAFAFFSTMRTDQIEPS